MDTSLLNNSNRTDIIRFYFNLGFSYLEILAFLTTYHGISMSVRQLNRILRSMGLRRRGARTDINIVIDAMDYEINECGRTLGYRSMQARLRNVYSLQVDRETVRLLSRYLDPEGVTARRQRRLRRRRYWTKGPNYLYHIDGWDKLKPFGLTVHGCIDGFSRRIMWLEASRSNNDPYQVCLYFCNLVKALNGVPRVVRADRGTENVNIAAVQQLLRDDHDDDRSRSGTTFLYGRSTANQRIESWWSRFPSMGMSAWIEHMKTLRDCGVFDCSNPLHIELIRYCYLELLRSELKKVVTEWNSHHIRTVSTSLGPSGKPDIIYHFPQIYGKTSYLQPIDVDMLEALTDLACDNLPDCLPLYKELFDSVADEHNLTSPNNLRTAAENFAFIIDIVEEEIEHL